MKTAFKRFAAALGLVLIGTILTAKASAECGSYLLGHKAGALVSPQSWSGAEFSSASPLLVSEHDSNEPIVGMWKLTLTAQGNTGPGAPPDGAPLDIGFTQWHSDGTEIINSGRPPQDGSICLGVWEKNWKIQIQVQSLCYGLRYRQCAERDWESDRPHPHRWGCHGESRQKILMPGRLPWMHMIRPTS
jgi:hypothetical protein